MELIAKTVKTDKDVEKTMNSLDIPFSTYANNLLKRIFKSVKGIDEQIEYHEDILKKLNKRREQILKERRKMNATERKYLIETGEIIKLGKKYIKPRIKAIYNLFGKVIESDEELFELIKCANEKK